MASLFNNDGDGANAQAQAVLAYLRAKDGIEASWDEVTKRYLADPKVARWHNCREQGYVVSLHGKDYRRQLNIAFFEHRNSDEICAVAWEQKTMNPPTIETMDTKGSIYKDKYDVSHRTMLGEAMQMADWIFDRLTDFWAATAAA